MSKRKHSQRLDLSSVDIRVRCVLRRLGVNTVCQLIELNECNLLALKNCGAKTVAKIVMLQQEYGKEPASVKRQSVVKAVESSRVYFNGLICVAIAANELIKGAEKSGRYYIPVSKRKFNTLSRALDELRK